MTDDLPLQYVAALLVAEHVRLHPALRTRENCLTVLTKYLKAYARRAASFEPSILEAVKEAVKYPQMMLPTSLKEAWDMHASVLKEAIVCLEGTDQ